MAGKKNLANYKTEWDHFLAKISAKLGLFPDSIVNSFFSLKQRGWLLQVHFNGPLV